MRDARRSAISTWCIAIAIAGAGHAQETARQERSVSALISALRDPSQALKAQIALRARGAEAALPLAEVVRNVELDSVTRGAATRVLMELGPRGVSAFDVLVECLRDGHLPSDAVTGAALALTRIGPFAGERAPRIAESLASSRLSSGWRKEAFEQSALLLPALRFRGDTVELDALLPELDRADPLVCIVACRVLAARHRDFESELKRVVEALTRTLATEIDPELIMTRRAAGFASYENTTPESVRALRTEASLALLAYAPDDRLGLLGSCQRLFDLDPAVRIASAEWLGRLRDPDSAHWLLDAASDPSQPAVALAALDAVRRIGPTAGHLAFRFSELARVDNPDIAAASRRVLLAIAPDFANREPLIGSVEVFERGIAPKLGIDLRVERMRVLAWLDADSGGHRLALQDDERAIQDFHSLPRDSGGPVHRALRWIPVRVLPDELRPGYWSASCGTDGDCIVDASPHGAVGADRERLRPSPFVLELMAVDTSDMHVPAGDVVGVRRADSPQQPREVWQYDLREERLEAVRTWLAALAARNASVLVAIDGLAVYSSEVVASSTFIHGRHFTVSRGADDRSSALRRR